MRQFPDESTVMPAIAKNQLEAALEFAEGRMKKKVLGASEALNLGVPQVIFADGRVEQPVQKAMRGQGTVIA
jgi:acetylglutamate/LysW-gamma-L-alpha-aminoadipate kinase